VAAESGRIYDESDLQLAEDLASRAAIALENARLFREVRESESRFRQLADAMPQIVWTARPDGHLDYYNKRWYEFTGRPEGESGDESWIPILHPVDVEPAVERWRRSVESGELFEHELRFRDRLTGGYRWHLGRALPVLDESGRVVKWFGTATDIDDRKRAEAALRAARDEAEEANRAKTQFLAVLSHELRTPLNPILLAASSVLDRPLDPESIRPTFEMIRQNVNLQARLIDDLLDVMRIVRGKMPLHWEVADCHTLIEHAIEVCRSEVSGGGLKLETDLAATRRHINADPARWQQVLWNLIKNAVKFTASGGTITVRTRNEPADASDGEPGRLVIEVSDTGIGIAPDVLPRIFEPFQQGETTITRKFGGLGLGLAITRGIVEAHAGTISALSDGPGMGTTFRLELAALPSPSVEPGGQNSGGAGGLDGPTPRRVLVVEDEPATLRLMARLIRGLGHEVATAGTIAEASGLAESDQFDLIISDIGLPDGTGLELMRRIVADRGPVPAIALTGYGMEDDIQRSREAGFAAHMTKPIDFTKLEAVIRQVASGPIGDGSAPPLNSS
jgi:PAS domain S-box-containing protein